MDPRVTVSGKPADKKPAGPLCAYICEGTHCSPPITDAEQLKSTITNHSHAVYDE